MAYKGTCSELRREEKKGMKEKGGGSRLPKVGDPIISGGFVHEDQRVSLPLGGQKWLRM